MRHCFALILVGTILLLSACVPDQPTHFVYEPPVAVEGQKCLIACQESRTVCKTSCNPNATTCMHSAKQEFMRYVDEREVMGLKPVKTLDQYYKEKACAVRDCGCDNDFRSCYELCGGAVHPK